MATSTPVSKPTPERIFNTMVAFQETEALKAAIELDIFTAIADGANTAFRRSGCCGKQCGSSGAVCDGREYIQFDGGFQGFGLLKGDHGIENALRCWFGSWCGCSHQCWLLF